MDKSIEKKIAIQKEAESAHINSGLKSTICMSVGLGKILNNLNNKYG